MELLNKQREVIVKQGQEKFKGYTTAVSMRGWINGQISKFSKQGNIEMDFIFREILNAYNHFHPETKLEVPIDSWKGKSSFEIIDKIDSILIIKYQKPSKLEEPTRVETEISKEEIKTLVEVIIFLNKNKLIRTSKIAMEFSRRLNLGHRTWKEFFSDRRYHNRLTLALGALDRIGMIEYNGGLTKWLNNKYSFQQSLENFITNKLKHNYLNNKQLTKQ